MWIMSALCTSIEMKTDLIDSSSTGYNIFLIVGYSFIQVAILSFNIIQKKT
jgi:hypothetical protein